MKIEIAEHAGFCFGVRRAISKTEELLENNQEIYVCGPLIHNKSVTDELCERGLNIVENLSEVKNGATLIVRSHGESEAFHKQALDQGIKVIDATCPYVSKIHKIVKDAQLEGRNVVVIGDKDHPEVKGIVGWAQNQALVINSLDEAKAIKLDNITLVGQTTITGSLWHSIADYLEDKKEDIVILKTICKATEERQESSGKLASLSDAMVVIGDKKSANSRKLYEIAQNNCKNTFFVENKEDLPLKELKKYGRIGVAAGASTPERIIKEVISTMSEPIEVVTDEVTDEVTEEETVATEEVAVEETVSEDVEESNPMDDFMDEIDKQMILPNRGEVVEGDIVHVSEREIVVNLGCKKDGIIPKDELVLEEDKELTELFKAGEPIKAKVVKTDDGEGNILLSKKRLIVNEHWDEINEALENKERIEVRVTRGVKGGVIAAYKEVSGFIPMSQLADRYIEKSDEFIGKDLIVKVSRVDQRRNKAVFSHKAYLLEEKQKRIEEIWDTINVGDIVEGTVMRFTDYGAFVDIGGIDGLLHISEISWGKLRHPQEALTIGDRIDIKILSMNREKGKISLGYKQTQPEPWEIIDEKYAVEQTIEGTIVQIKEYGAFVELEPGLDGLVHISEIAHKRVANIHDEISIGEKVKIKILDIDKERKRISLSIKATIDPSIMEETVEEVVEEVEDTEDVVEEVAEAEEETVEEVAEETVEEEAVEEVDETEEEAVEDVDEEVVEEEAEEVEE